jgi:hypothetical protein
MLMCKRHWFSVPVVLRNEVWAHYRGGQERDWKPSKEYCIAAKKAIRAAAEREGLKVTGEERELKFYDVFMPKE